ncbi:MAG TPA: LLM class flavin-dependent oxidoreductase [Acidimicrobiales bacterium]|nr:LLM class flavin-dependent oxidoreductase [Acidimicrobiales bacterium]
MADARSRRMIRCAVRATVTGDPVDGTGVVAYRALVDLGVTAERAGLDALFVGPSPTLDPYVLLGGVAASTSELALGCLAAHAGERPAAMLAKVVTGLDVCSGGRAVLGITDEPAGFTPAVDRDGGGGRPDTGRLSDALEICRAMLRVSAPTYAGRRTGISGAWNEPRLEGLRIAILAPFDGAPDALVLRALELAARFAEICVVDTGTGVPGSRGGTRSPGATRADGSSGAWLRERFAAACLDAGRVPGDVRLLARCVDGGGAVSDVIDRGARWLDACADGVVVDVGPVERARDRHAELVAALGALAP